MTTLHTLLGLPTESSATATILLRIATLCLRFFIRFVAQQWLELKPIMTNTNTAKTEKPKTILLPLCLEDGANGNHAGRRIHSTLR